VRADRDAAKKKANDVRHAQTMDEQHHDGCAA